MAAFTSVHVAPGLPELRAPAMVLAALEANFCGAMPAHGARQLVLVRSIDGRPQAITNELANADGRYIVALAPQPDGALAECKAAYQLAHEAAHFWLDALAPPSPALEVVCEAIALAILTQVGQAWFASTTAPKAAAAQFDAYRRKIEACAAAAVGAPWVDQGHLVPVRGCDVGAAHVFAGAALALALDEALGDWTALLALRAYVRHDGSVDVAAWQARLDGDAHAAALGRRVADVLSHCE